MKKFDAIALQELIGAYEKENGYSGEGKDAFVWDDPDCIKSLLNAINASDTEDRVVYYDQISNVEELHSATISASFNWPKIHKSIIVEWEVRDTFDNRLEFIEYVLDLEKQAHELLDNINA